VAGALDGEVAIVTGASAGIGACTARLFQAQGAKVVGVARNAAPGSESGTLAFVVGDVADPATARRAVECARERFGGLDVLVNNVGMDYTADLAVAPVDEVRRVFDVNFFGVLHMTQAAVPALAARGKGAIVNVTSRLASIGVPTMTLYGAAKGAVLSFTRGAAVELAPHNIRVNAVAPGMTMTPLMRVWLDRASDPDARLAEVIRAIPQGRVGTPDEVAQAILFLASDRSSHITGESLAVDGGYTAA
jgi:NAD(P)-dependent dehydrogenase (short-subunit alcohol dehydrogenase family)